MSLTTLTMFTVRVLIMCPLGHVCSDHVCSDYMFSDHVCSDHVSFHVSSDRVSSLAHSRV